MWCIFSILALLVASITAQRLVEVRRADGSYSVGVQSNSVGNTANSVGAYLTRSSGWTNPTGRAAISTDVDVEVPNFLSTGLQITKQVPYLEILKLVEAFLRLKGELAGRFWNLIHDNTHILLAVRDTLIGKIATLHNLTLSAIVILRKVLEFASALFGNFNVNVGASGSQFNAGVNFG